eukprot:SAG22_NODE_3443_length_1708_cov_1.364201_2_plen_241_part_01
MREGMRYRLSTDPKTNTETIEIEGGAAGGPTASVVFGHGLGDSARGWASGCMQLCAELPWTRWVLPSAPAQPVTLNGGASMPSWYDLHGLGDRAAEPCEGIDESSRTVSALVAAEAARYTDAPPRVVLGGFSQGGALALHTAVNGGGPYAGVLCMSGYLPKPAAATLEHPDVRAKLPVLLCHGEADEMVRPEWASATAARMLEIGHESCELQWFADLGHSANEEELAAVAAWLRMVLPPT